MAFIQQVVDGERRLRWVEIRTDGKKFTWRRLNVDRIIEDESSREFDSRQEAEEHAAEDPANQGLAIAMGPDPRQHKGRTAGPPERKAEE